MLGRLGGEEFAAFLPGANLATGRLYAETVRNAFRAGPRGHLGVDRTVSASFGVAQFIPSDHLSDLLRRADAALYQAKTDGRDCVRTVLSEPARPLAAARGNGTISS
ncbi:putative diguanylate cyclase YdaM [compost metagenome]